MNSTQPIIPPLPLSPNHQLSITQSQTLNTKVTQFLKNPLQIPMNESHHHSATSSLDNSRTYFESQINYLINVVKQTNKLNQGRQAEMIEMKRRLNEYEEKIFGLENELFEQERKRCKEGMAKWRQDEAVEKERKNDDVKTRKKTSSQQELQSTIRPTKQPISSFQTVPISTNSTNSKQFQSRIQNQNVYLQRAILQLKSKLTSRCQQISILEAQLQTAKGSLVNYKKELTQSVSEKEKLSLESKMWKSRHDALEKQYHLLQDKYGKEMTQQKIIVENLRQVLTGIHEKRSPHKKKLSRKDQQGYYSINRVIKKTQSESSFSSSSEVSFSSLSLGQISESLKEENEYLRTQLIRAFDQKGAMRSQLSKYQKLLQKFESHSKETSKQPNILNENCQDQSNLIQDDKLFASRIFKKNKASTILVVENTEMKEKIVIDELKISNLLRELYDLIESLDEKNSGEIMEFPESRKEILELMVNKMRGISYMHKEFLGRLKTVQCENEQLKREKLEIQKKSQQDFNELQRFLKDITQNPNQQNKSSDSTDQTFKNIQLGTYTEKQDLFSKKQQEYLQKIKDQQDQLYMLRNQIVSMQEVSQSFYKLTSQSPSSSHMNVFLPKNDEIVPVNSIVSQPLECQRQNQILEISSFQLFKQKLTEFYQHTIKQLDDWQVSTLRNGNSPPKRHPQLRSEVYSPSSYKIPHIVQRNILKISREFKSVSKNDISDEQKQKSQKDLSVENEFFMNQKMSQSFVKDNGENNQESIQDLINNRLYNFQQFSSDWIQKQISNLPIQKHSTSSQKSQAPQDQTLKQQAEDCPIAKRMHLAMTERPSVERQRNFEMDMNDIDARSQSMTSQQLRRERQLFIREEISYYMPRNDSFGEMFESTNSKRSYQSYRV